MVFSFTYICTLSLVTGIFHDTMKMEKVTPVCKDEQKSYSIFIDPFPYFHSFEKYLKDFLMCF